MSSRASFPLLGSVTFVIIDNLGFHKGKAARRAIELAGATLLFLPPYSPDLNSIEQVLAKLKTMLRKAATRSLEALSAAGRCLPRSLGRCGSSLLHRKWSRSVQKRELGRDAMQAPGGPNHRAEHGPERKVACAAIDIAINATYS